MDLESSQQSHKLLLMLQNRHTTEVEDLIQKFRTTWPDEKVWLFVSRDRQLCSSLVWHPAAGGPAAGSGHHHWQLSKSVRK